MELLSEDNPKYKNILKELGSLLESIGLRKNKWPGGQPVHMNEENVVEVLTTIPIQTGPKTVEEKFRYTMTLKEDGVRYLMFSGPSQIRNKDKGISSRRPYFLDRSFRLWQLIDSEVLIYSDDKLLLDGEILNYQKNRKNPVIVDYNIKYKKIDHVLFSIFDCLKYKDTDVNSPYIRRFEAASQAAKLIDLIEIPSFSVQVPQRFELEDLRSEKWSKKENIYTLLKKLIKSDSSRTVPYDGIIFTPLYENYVSGPWKACNNISYKWKPTDQSTIDVWAVPEKDGIKYYSKSANMTKRITSIENKTTKDGKEIWTMSEGPVENMKDIGAPVMVELIYTRKSNKRFFEFKHFREDKNRQDMANSLLTIERVMKDPVNVNLIGDWVKEVTKKTAGEILKTLNKKKLVSYYKWKNGYINTTEYTTLKDMHSRKETYIKINYPNDNAPEALKCMMSMWKHSVLKSTNVIDKFGREFELLGGDRENKLYLQKEKYFKQKVMKNIKLKCGTTVQEIKHIEDGNKTKDEVVVNPIFNVHKHIFWTSYGEITFKTTQKSSNSGSENTNTTEIYTEFKRHKNPVTTRNLINEFTRYLENLETKDTKTDKPKPKPKTDKPKPKPKTDKPKPKLVYKKKV